MYRLNRAIAPIDTKIKLVNISISTFQMTELLEQAIAKVKNLPEAEQNTIAALILGELEEETKWQNSFVNSQDILAEMAAEAMLEYKAGKTEELE